MKEKKVKFYAVVKTEDLNKKEREYLTLVAKRDEGIEYMQ